jgi:hypothetical protein
MIKSVILLVKQKNRLLEGGELTEKKDAIAPKADTYVTVQFMPCGHSSSMLRDTLVDSCGVQLDQIESGKKLDAVTLPSRECYECQEETRRQECLNAKMDIEDVHPPCCGTCGTPLAYTGPRARDEYCSDRCYEIASAAADEAADNLYI